MNNEMEKALKEAQRLVVQATNSIKCDNTPNCCQCTKFTECHTLQAINRLLYVLNRR